MGRDKALLEVDGRPLAVIAADALRGGGAGDVVAVGGDLAALEAWGLSTVADRWPGEGPLGGLLTAFGAVDEDVVVVLSCDLPFVTAEAVEAVAGALEDGGDDVAMPVVEGRRQPLVAAWRRSASHPVLRAAFDGGERGLSRAAAGLRVAEVTLRVGAWASDADDSNALFRGSPPG
jgi:molybdopterin-guanine dinucleotide biosynthesis protein A